MVDINKVDFGTMRVEATDRSATIELLAKEQQRWFRENKPAYFKDTEIEVYPPNTIFFTQKNTHRTQRQSKNGLHQRWSNLIFLVDVFRATHLDSV